MKEARAAEAEQKRLELEKKRKRERRYSRLEELQVRHSFELSNILIRFIFTYSNNYIIDTKEVPTVYLESLNSVLIYFDHIELIIIRRLSRQIRLHGLNKIQNSQDVAIHKSFLKIIAISNFCSSPCILNKIFLSTLIPFPFCSLGLS